MSSKQNIQQLLALSDVHPEWHPILSQALSVVDSNYLDSLLQDDSWLPGKHHLLAAFRRDLQHCDYILFGESPYPRRDSANGIAFYDAAVNELWSDTGLTKAVNRATSLRNIIKTMLVAEGHLQPRADGSIPQPDIAAIDKHNLIQGLGDLFDALQQRGFLMFNATPVLHPERKPAREARYWHEFVHRLMQLIAEAKSIPPTLILWGKIAEQLTTDPVIQRYPRLVCEHPYNISFIHHPDMRELFAKLRLLQRR